MSNYEGMVQSCYLYPEVENCLTLRQQINAGGQEQV